MKTLKVTPRPHLWGFVWQEIVWPQQTHRPSGRRPRQHTKIQLGGLPMEACQCLCPWVAAMANVGAGRVGEEIMSALGTKGAPRAYRACQRLHCHVVFAEGRRVVPFATERDSRLSVLAHRMDEPLVPKSVGERVQSGDSAYTSPCTTLHPRTSECEGRVIVNASEVRDALERGVHGLLHEGCGDYRATYVSLTRPTETVDVDVVAPQQGVGNEMDEGAELPLP